MMREARAICNAFCSEIESVAKRTHADIAGRSTLALNCTTNIPMFERYTEKARRIIFFARYEASQYGSRYIEIEHLLLGILRECPKMFPKLLPKDLQTEIRDEIEKHSTPGARISKSAEVPLDQDSRKGLNFAAEIADSLGHHMIEPEHLLAGILRIKKGLAAQTLEARGITSEAIQAELAKEPRDEDDVNRSEARDLAVSRLNHFLEGIKSLGAQEMVQYFGKNAEFIDSAGRRWAGEEIEESYETLFAGYAKKNATFAVEGTPAQMDGVYIATVLWKNALLASEERSWMHRMTVILLLEAGEWKVALAQVTPVKPFSATAI